MNSWVYRVAARGMIGDITTTSRFDYAGVRAVSARWLTSRDRACRDEPSETFITPGDDSDEPPYPSPRARELCNSCLVRVDCLQYALDENIEFGTWGGMSAYQRSLLNRKLSRKACPGCGSKEGIVIENGHEICLACGVSWPIW